MPRTQDIGILYIHIKINSLYVIRTENLNGKIYEAPLTGYEDMSAWKEFVPHNKNIRLKELIFLRIMCYWNYEEMG